MRDSVNILLKVLPNFGEMLIAVGVIVRQNENELLENLMAREELKNYLVNNSIRAKNAIGLSSCPIFQKLTYHYTGKFCTILPVNTENDNNKTVNIYLFDFFYQIIWPILVSKYMNNIGTTEARAIEVSINIKKNAYIQIYDQENPKLFLDEFKSLLLYNNIVVSKMKLKEDGDILVTLLLPIAPHRAIDIE